MGMKTMKRAIVRSIFTTKVKVIKVQTKTRANKNEIRANKSKKQANKLKRMQPIKKARFNPTINHHYSSGWMNIPPLLLNF